MQCHEYGRVPNSSYTAYARWSVAFCVTQRITLNSVFMYSMHTHSKSHTLVGRSPTRSASEAINIRRGSGIFGCRIYRCGGRQMKAAANPPNVDCVCFVDVVRGELRRAREKLHIRIDLNVFAKKAHPNRDGWRPQQKLHLMVLLCWETWSVRANVSRSYAAQRRCCGSCVSECSTRPIFNRHPGAYLAFYCTLTECVFMRVRMFESSVGGGLSVGANTFLCSDTLGNVCG